MSCKSKFILLTSSFYKVWNWTVSSENVKAETDALPLCFSPAAPDTAGGPELHPEAVPGEAEVPGGPRGLPEALRPHQQPAEEDPPWGGGAGGWRGGGRRGWSRRRGRRGGGGYRRAGAAEAAVPGQDEGEGAGDGLLLSKVRPGGAAALPAGALLPVSRMPVQPGYLPGTHPQPPGPSVQPGRQRLTVWTSLCRLFTKLGDATWGHAVDRITRRRAAVNLRDMYRGCVCSSPGCRVLSPPRSDAAVDLWNLDSSSASGSTGSLMSTLCRSVTAIYNVRDLKKNKKKTNRREFFDLLLMLCLWFLLFLLLMWSVSRFRDLQTAGYLWCTLARVENMCWWYASVIFSCYCVVYKILCVTFPGLCEDTRPLRCVHCLREDCFSLSLSVFDVPCSLNWLFSFGVTLLPSAGRRTHFEAADVSKCVDASEHLAFKPLY